MMMVYRGPILFELSGNLIGGNLRGRVRRINHSVGGGRLMLALAASSLYRRRKNRIVVCTCNSVGWLPFKHAELVFATRKCSEGNVLGQKAELDARECSHDCTRMDVKPASSLLDSQLSAHMTDFVTGPSRKQ